MNVWNCKNYREMLAFGISQTVKPNNKINFAKIASEIRVQKSYVTHVMKGRANFNADQIYQIGKFLEFNEEELEFFILLGEIERCALKDRLNSLMKRRDLMRKKNIRSGRSLKDHKKLLAKEKLLVQYYSDPFCSVIHMYLTIEKWARSPEKLSSELSLPAQRINAILTLLIQLEIIEKIPSGFTVQKSFVHIPSDFHLAKVNNLNLRLRATDRLQKSPSNEDYFFSAVFAAEKKTKDEIKSLFLDFLKNISKKVEDSTSENVFFLNFDLY